MSVEPVPSLPLRLAPLALAEPSPEPDPVAPETRTTCPHCRGLGLQRTVVACVQVVCEYCNGRRTVTLEDARVYVEVLEREVRA